MKSTTVMVTEAEIEALFGALALWDKIDSGSLTSTLIPAKTGPSRGYPGARSEYLKHWNEAGGQACTTHRIIDPSGDILHRCAHDVKAGEVTIAKPSVPSQVPKTPP